MLSELCQLSLMLHGFSGKLPAGWHSSTIIPVPKPAKDKADPSSYHPIALTSCLCKDGTHDKQQTGVVF